MYSKKTQRRMRVMIKAGMGIAAIAATLWLVWYEFGKPVFENPLFLVLILMWALFGYILFLDRLSEDDNKTSDEKIDELIKEIRLDREQRNREVKRDGK